MTTDTMVDTRDMIVVHTALLHERRLAPRLVERDGPHVREHGTFVLDLLEHHLAGGVGAHQHRKPDPGFPCGHPGAEHERHRKHPGDRTARGLGAWAVTEMISLSQAGQGNPGPR